MTIKHFFEIPVFRCSEELYFKEVENEVGKLSDYYKSVNQHIDYDYLELANKSSSIQSKRTNYRYGQLVGVIRLFILGDQIRGELFFVRQKVTKKFTGGNWTLRSMKIFELSILPKSTNESIFNSIIKTIFNYQKESKVLKSRFIDLSSFEIVGKYLNFISMLQ